MQPITHSSRAIERIAVAIVFVLSFASWLALTWLSHRHEAWDSLPYFVTVLPLSLVVGAIGGFAFVRATWRWPLTFAAGQFAGLVALSRGGWSLWPITIVILLVLSLPCWGAALLASMARTRGRNRSNTAS